MEQLLQLLSDSDAPVSVIMLKYFITVQSTLNMVQMF